MSRPLFLPYDTASRRIRRRVRRFEAESEPSSEDEPDVVEYGGQFIWAANFTAGGAPIGLTVEEIRETEAGRSAAGWAHAKRVLESAFARHGAVEIGRVRKVGEGLSHEVFARTSRCGRTQEADRAPMRCICPAGGPIIDWEAARLGDPAYDLAIVTRGVRRPFQIERGLDRLLDAYAACASWRITASAVHLHELPRGPLVLTFQP